MYRVSKRDGMIVDFDVSKISGAMIKAFDALGRNYHPSVINLLALQVTSAFEMKIKDGFISVEDIQDSVEQVLSDAGYADVAKAYAEEADYEVLDEIPFWGNGAGMTNKKRTALFWVPDQGEIRRVSEPLENAGSPVVWGDKVFYTASAYKSKLQLTGDEIWTLDLKTGKIAHLRESIIHDEDVRSLPFSNETNNGITNLIELQKYYKASFYNEIGLNANYNMRRESIQQNESDMNHDSLKPLIDDMLECRQDFCEWMNNNFGLNMSVKFNSIWAEREIMEDAAIEAATDPEPEEVPEEPAQEESEEVKEDDTDRESE